MRIAFDCSGTLLSNQDKVVKLFKWFQSNGHEVVIWSNAWSYTQKAKDLHNLDAECQMKSFRFDVEDEYHFDICVDDEPSQIEYLAAKEVISVYDIPENESEFESFLQKYLKKD